MNSIPFTKIDWSTVEKVKYNGEKGFAYWQTIQFEGLRIRIVEYSPGYIADHWCLKGHIIHCLEGHFISQLEGGEQSEFKKGDSYVVSDNSSSHKSISKDGVKLIIIDGNFLSNKNGK